MQLYAGADRIFRELQALGIGDDDPLDVGILVQFDQLHYHGTDALDDAIRVLPVDNSARVLEIGSGWGGPARYIAAKTGAHVTAIELQEEYHRVAEKLTQRCQLDAQVQHIHGDFLTCDLPAGTFDRIVSWLALYHIPHRPRYLKMAFELLQPKGGFLAEDLVQIAPVDDAMADELSRTIFANSLVGHDAYQSDLEDAGFTDVRCRDMTESWRAFTRHRLEQFLSGRDGFKARHGDEVFRAIENFYLKISEYFQRGIIGGVRAVARKP